MDNENVISLTKINKTVAQAITDKNTKNKANIASLTNGGETDEEYWAENIRQFILDEVETSKKYTQDEIDYVERSLRETREAGHGDTANSEGGEEGHGNTVNSEGGEGEAKEAGHSNTANSKGGEEEHSAAASDGGEGEAKEAGHSNTANSKGGEEEHSAAASDGGEGEAKEAGHSNTANSKGGEAGHSNTANSEGGEEGHGYSVSETNVANLLKSMKGVKDEQLCRRQVRRATQKYMNTYS